jgi:hypothetical protein
MLTQAKKFARPISTHSTVGEQHYRRIVFQILLLCPGHKSETLSQKITKAKIVGGVAHVLELYQARGSKLKTQYVKKKKNATLSIPE